MKLGVLTVLLGEKSLEDSVKYLKESGIQAIELGTGGFPGKAHADPDFVHTPDRPAGGFPVQPLNSLPRGIAKQHETTSGFRYRFHSVSNVLHICHNRQFN